MKISQQTLAGGLVGSYEVTRLTYMLPRRLLEHQPSSNNKKIVWLGNRGSYHENRVYVDSDAISIHATSHLGDIWCKNMHEGVAIGTQLLSFTLQKEIAHWRRENTLLIIIYGDWI